jgi:hypothetical protein
MTNAELKKRINGLLDKLRDFCNAEGRTRHAFLIALEAIGQLGRCNQLLSFSEHASITAAGMSHNIRVAIMHTMYSVWSLISADKDLKEAFEWNLELLLGKDEYDGDGQAVQDVRAEAGGAPLHT